MMYTPVITDASQIDATWLTNVLRAAGDLPTGHVVDVAAVGETSTHAHMARLLLHYSADATGAKPGSLFLKILKAESAALFGPTEIDLYTKLGAPLTDGPILRCYHCGYDDAGGRYHLLLPDLSETHHHNWDVVTTVESAAKTAAGLAKLHAYWWDHPHLVADERFPTAAVIQRYRARIDQGYAPLLAAIGDRIAPETRDLLARVFANHGQRMIERASTGRHLTYVHGDTNPGNLLSPNAPDGTEYVVDRQLFDWSLSIWLGVSDIAYMMVPWWPVEKRRALQGRVLEVYYAALLQCGVRDYTWEQLWNDYRLSAVQGIYVATNWCVDATERVQMEWLWWQQLQKSIAAYQDLRCAEVVR